MQHASLSQDSERAQQTMLAIDVYSMGVMMWEIFTQLPLYEDVEAWALHEHVIGGGR